MGRSMKGNDIIITNLGFIVITCDNFKCTGQ